MKSMFSVLKEDVMEIVEVIKTGLKFFNSVFKLSKTRGEFGFNLICRVIMAYIVGMFLFIQLDVSLIYIFYLWFGVFVISYLEDLYIRSRKGEEESEE